MVRSWRASSYRCFLTQQCRESHVYKRGFMFLDQSRFLGTHLPSPGLGPGFGLGLGRVLRVRFKRGVGGYVPRILDDVVCISTQV